MAPAELAPAPTRAKHELSRRRMLLGTAWATPAIVVGIAAPPAAASVLTPEKSTGGQAALKSGECYFGMDGAGASTLRFQLSVGVEFASGGQAFAAGTTHTLQLLVPAAYVATSAATGLPVIPSPGGEWTPVGQPSLVGADWLLTFVSAVTWGVPYFQFLLDRQGPIPPASARVQATLSSRETTAATIVPGFSTPITFTVP